MHYHILIDAVVATSAIGVFGICLLYARNTLSDSKKRMAANAVRITACVYGLLFGVIGVGASYNAARQWLVPDTYALPGDTRERILFSWMVVGSPFGWAFVLGVLGWEVGKRCSK